MADLPFLDFPEDHDDGVEEAEEEHFTVALDSHPNWSQIPDFRSPPPSRRHSAAASATPYDGIVFSGDESGGISGSDHVERKNQVTFVMDLFHQRVEQSDSMGAEEFGLGFVNGSSLEVIEEDGCEMGGNGSIEELGLGLGLGLGFGDGIRFDGDSDEEDEDEDDDCDCYCDCDSGEEFVVAHEDHGDRSSLVRMGGIRVVEIDSSSDSDSDLEVGNRFGLLGINLHSEDEDYAAENLNDDDIDIPLCWDSFQLEDHSELNNNNNNDFEWEEVDDHDGDRENREILSFVAEPDPDEEEGSITILPISGPDEEEDQVIAQRGLEWEMLMSVERNLELDADPGPYFSDHDDNSYTTEYELMFGPLADGENPLLARPPASKSVVSSLPSVVITQEDVVNDKALCAVCKDKMEVDEVAKKLPCCHWYHGECILPWLGIRNTCPVCRYELPTDDPDYEHRRARRAARTL